MPLVISSAPVVGAHFAAYLDRTEGRNGPHGVLKLKTGRMPFESTSRDETARRRVKVRNQVLVLDGHESRRQSRLPFVHQQGMVRVDSRYVLKTVRERPGLVELLAIDRQAGLDRVAPDVNDRRVGQHFVDEADGLEIERLLVGEAIGLAEAWQAREIFRRTSASSSPSIARPSELIVTSASISGGRVIRSPQPNTRGCAAMTASTSVVPERGMPTIKMARGAGAASVAGGALEKSSARIRARRPARLLASKRRDSRLSRCCASACAV